MIKAAIAIRILLIIKDRLSMVLLSIIEGGSSGTTGLILLPYTK